MSRFCLIVPFLFITCVPLALANSSIVTYQGTLTDIDGQAVPAGDYVMEFSLYDTETGGVRSWGPERHTAVTVTRGAFSVSLGSILPLGTVFSSHPSLWLEVSADTGAGMEMFSPRVAIGASPYSFHARALVQLFRVADGTSVARGDIVHMSNGMVERGRMPIPRSLTTDRLRTLSAFPVGNDSIVMACANSLYPFDGRAVVYDLSASEPTPFGQQEITVSETPQPYLFALSNTQFIAVNVGEDNITRASLFTAAGSSTSLGPWGDCQFRWPAGPSERPAVAALTTSRFLLVKAAQACVGNISGNTLAIGGKSGFYDPQLLSAQTNAFAAALDADTAIITHNNKEGSHVLVAQISADDGVSYGTPIKLATNGYPLSIAALSTETFVVAYWSGGPSIDLALGTVANGQISIVHHISLPYALDLHPFAEHESQQASLTVISPQRFVATFNGSLSVVSVSGSELCPGPVATFANGFDYAQSCYMSKLASFLSLDQTRLITVFASARGAEVWTVPIEDLDHINDFAVGIADNDAQAGDLVPVILHGVSSHHAGLIPGMCYYEDRGRLTTTPAYCRIGWAISATDLLLDLARPAR